MTVPVVKLRVVVMVVVVVEAAGDTGRDALRRGEPPLPRTIFATNDFVEGECDGRALGGCTSVEEKIAGAAAGVAACPLLALLAGWETWRTAPGEPCWGCCCEAPFHPVAGIDNSCACCGVPL